MPLPFKLCHNIQNNNIITGHQFLQIHETRHAIKQSAKIHYIQTALNTINQKALLLMSKTKLNITLYSQQAETNTFWVLFTMFILNFKFLFLRNEGKRRK